MLNDPLERIKEVIRVWEGWDRWQLALVTHPTGIIVEEVWFGGTTNPDCLAAVEMVAAERGLFCRYTSVNTSGQGIHAEFALSLR